MEDIIAPIIFLLVIGGVSGYFAGNLVRRISSMALAIGIFAFIIIILAYTGTLNINLESITTNISNFLNILAPLGLTALFSSIPFVVSFGAGLLIGFRRN